MINTKENIVAFLRENNINTTAELRRVKASLYNYLIRRPELFEEVRKIHPVPTTKRKDWTFEELKTEALKYKHRKDFQMESKGAYLKAYRTGKLDEICSHMVPKPFTIPKRNKPAHNFKDLTGQIFGDLTVLRHVGKDSANHTLVECKCKCGSITTRRANNIKQGASEKCKQCSNQISKPQKEIYEYILSLGFKDALLSYKDLGKEIDIFVPSKLFAIEYDGLIWHSSKYRATEKAERERYQFYKKNNITCFRIFEDEYKKNKELVFKMIKARLQPQSSIKQQIEIKEVTNKEEYQNFFNKYHLDGYGSSSIVFGAYVDQELVSCLSLRRYKLGKHKGQFEISRFCSDYDKNTYGAFSKLLKQAKKYCKENGATHLLSASDNRFATGLIYKNNGFQLVEKSDYRLNYYYYQHSKNKRLHRFTCRKLNEPKITKEEAIKYPTEDIQTSSGFTSFIKFGKWEPLYKIYGWGHKLWVLTLK